MEGNQSEGGNMGIRCRPIGSLQAGYREAAGYGVEEGEKLTLLPLRTQPPPCNLPEGSLLVRVQFPYTLPLIGSLPSALALKVLYKPSTSLPCHFSLWRWRHLVSPQHWHWSANPHGAKTQDFDSNITHYFMIVSPPPSLVIFLEVASTFIKYESVSLYTRNWRSRIMKGQSIPKLSNSRVS
jgi:hypothetical protein